MLVSLTLVLLGAKTHKRRVDSAAFPYSAVLSHYALLQEIQREIVRVRKVLDAFVLHNSLVSFGFGETRVVDGLHFHDHPAEAIVFALHQGTRDLVPRLGHGQIVDLVVQALLELVDRLVVLFR